MDGLRVGRSSQQKKKKAQKQNSAQAAQKNTAKQLSLNTDLLKIKDESTLSFFSQLSHSSEPGLFRLLLEYLPLGVFSFVIYFLTVCRTVPGGDSGELITVAYNLGVAHPPGYPLYTLLGHLMTHLPFGTVAAKVNFMSALCQIGAGFMMFLLFRRWMKNIWVAWLVVGIFSFSPLIWRYAVVAEVFTLNNLFLSSLLYIVYRFYETPARKWALWFAGILGLACSHHHTILFFAVPIFAMVCFYHHAVLFQAKTFFSSVAVWMFGFLPYLYLPFAAQSKAIYNWGAPYTWDGFKTHFLRQEYGTFQLASGKQDYDNFLFSLWQYSKDTLDQFLVVGVIPILVSLFFIFRDWKRQSQFTKTIVVSAVFYLVVFHVLANMDLSNRLFYDIQSRFWMAPNIVATLLMGVGLIQMARLSQVRWPNIAWAKVVAVVSVGAIGLQVQQHYKIEDYSRNTVFEDVGRSMLDSLPKNAILFMRGDIYVNVVRYLQDVEGYRKDVEALPYDLLWWPWMKDSVEASLPNVTIPGRVYRYKKRSYEQFNLKDLLDANVGKADVFIGKLRSDEAQQIAGSYKLWNMGFINKVVPASEKFDFNNYISEAKAFEKYLPPKKSEIRDKSWEAFVYYNYWDRELARAREVFSKAMSHQMDLSMIEYGANIMLKIVNNHPDPPLVVYKNLGVAYQFMARKQPHYNQQMVAAWKQYLKKRPQGDPDLPNIQRIVSAWDHQIQKINNRQTSSVQEKQ